MSDSEKNPLEPEETSKENVEETKIEEKSDVPTPGKENLDDQENEEDVDKKAEEIARLIGDSSDSEKEDDLPTEPVKQEEENPVSAEADAEYFEFCLRNKLIGTGKLIIDDDGMFCGNCQKAIEKSLEKIKNHLEGDGHKLNTLWNYDRNLAEVAGELRIYPAKFEIEMTKHINMLNRSERSVFRFKVKSEIQTLMRSLFPENPEISSAKNGQTPDVEQEPDVTEQPDDLPDMTPEEIAEIKAEFIGSFYEQRDMITVQNALLGNLDGFNRSEDAANALKVLAMLGKMVCGYQRKMLSKGYKVNKEHIQDIKRQCSNLLKQIDDYKLRGPS